jgi:hypothetical protein
MGILVVVLGVLSKDVPQRRRRRLMAWQAAVAASDGNNYEWYQQDKENSCGCAVILMMVFLVKGKKLDEATVRQWVNEIECGQKASKEGVRSFDTKGTARPDLNSVLAEKCKIKVHTVKGAAPVRKWITHATPKKPYRASVDWNNAGGHALLVVNHHNNNVIFLDPLAGVVEIPDANLLTYTVRYPGDAADSQGTIAQLGQPS